MIIRINLLPVEYRLVEAKKRAVSPMLILWIVLVLVLLLTLFQFFEYAGVRRDLHRLNAEWAQLAGPNREADEVFKVLSEKLEPEKFFLERYVLSDFLIAEIMNTLSDVLSDNIWFSDLKATRNRDGFRLDITGYSQISSKQITVAQIQEFVNAVKSRMETILNPKNGPEPKPVREVKAVLTTSLRDISGMEAMQFAVSFQVPSAFAERKK